jgi:hypothetical protein
MKLAAIFTLLAGSLLADEIPAGTIVPLHPESYSSIPVSEIRDISKVDTGHLLRFGRYVRVTLLDGTQVTGRAYDVSHRDVVLAGFGQRRTIPASQIKMIQGPGFRAVTKNFAEEIWHVMASPVLTPIGFWRWAREGD